MKFVHVGGDTKHSKNWKKGTANELKSAFKNGKPIVVFIYLQGCGPCEATHPHWNDMKDAMSSKFPDDGSVVVAKVESTDAEDLGDMVGDIDGYPSIKFIKSGKSPELYSGSRTADAFSDWIEKSAGLNSGSAVPLDEAEEDVEVVSISDQPFVRGKKSKGKKGATKRKRVVITLPNEGAEESAEVFTESLSGGKRGRKRRTKKRGAGGKKGHKTRAKRHCATCTCGGSD